MVSFSIFISTSNSQTFRSTASKKQSEVDNHFFNFYFQLEEAVIPYLDAFATFREDVRQVARKQKGS